MEQIDCRITGRVQLVMFRDFAVRNARSFGLVGEVQNMSDGSVRVLAQGNRESLLAFIERLKRGSLFSRVDDVIVTWGNAEKTAERFVIRY